MHFLWFSILSLVAIIAHTAVAQPSYPLVCKGGQGMFASTNGLVLNGTVNSTIKVTFKKGLNPRNPGPGECVWLDRPMHPNEPNVFFYAGGGFQTFFVTPNGALPTNGPLKYLLGPISSDKYYTIHAFSSGDYFTVTKLGP